MRACVRVCRGRRSGERECTTANGGRSQQEERGNGLNHESNSENGKQAQVGVGCSAAFIFFDFHNHEICKREDVRFVS